MQSYAVIRNIAYVFCSVNSQFFLGCKQELSVRLKSGHSRILQGQKTTNSCAKWAKVALELRVERSSKCDVTGRNQTINFMLTFLRLLLAPLRTVRQTASRPHGRPQGSPLQAGAHNDTAGAPDHLCPAGTALYHPRPDVGGSQRVSPPAAAMLPHPSTVCTEELLGR